MFSPGTVFQAIMGKASATHACETVLPLVQSTLRIGLCDIQATVVLQTAMIFAATGAAIELAMHRRPNIVTTVSLSLWCVVRAVHCLWLALREGPHTLQSTPALLRLLPAETLQRLLETAQTPPPPPMARALYQNAISCLPVLTLGLVFQEGACLPVP